jgi:putative hydrolase of HD superfamily
MSPDEPAVLPTLLALQPLEHIRRSGWVLRGIAEAETVAAHVHGACHVVLALGPRVRPEIDVERCLALLLVHDVPEALLGDLPHPAARLLPQGAKTQAEDAAALELLAPISPFALERFAEYRQQGTREARFAKLCDRLQMGVRLVGYRRLGVRGLEEFEATIAALDCSEFAPAEALRREILEG